MKNIFLKTKNWLLAHKIISGVIIVVIIGGGYFTYKKISAANTPTQYVLAQVEKGTIVSSISGTGAVSATNQIDIKPKVSGTVTGIYVKAGQAVRKGSILVQLDANDAVKAVRDAKLNLENAQVSLNKLANQAEQDSAKTNSDLLDAYEEGKMAVTSTFNDLPNIISFLEERFSNGNGYLSNNSVNSFGPKLKNERQKAVSEYYAGEDLYKKNLSDYRNNNDSSDSAVIERLINETKNTNQTILAVLNDTLILVNDLKTRYNDDGRAPPADLISDQAALISDINTFNSLISSLSDSISSIQTAKDASINANLKTATSQTSLDIKAAELTVEQRQNALNDAEENLGDYSIRAPFDGIIGNVPASLAAEASSATILASLVTKQQIAIIQLNEVDIAKIKTADKATLTFDALPDLTLTGSVAEIENVGTESQGVVTYNLKVAFDTQDNQVKPSMSVSAAIITDSKEDVLIVPNSSVKRSNSGQNYVEELPNAGKEKGLVSSKEKPVKVNVQVGISNDTETEIVSGISVGEVIISRTVTATNNAQSSSAPSLFGGGGNRAGGGTGGATRVTR